MTKANDAVRVGLVGCGNVSGQYLRNLRDSPTVDVVACADHIRLAAESTAELYGISRVLEVDELLDDHDVELVLNLTPPAVHAEISTRALKAGKHVYTEKPLATDPLHAQHIMDLAAQLKLHVGCAPDTVLGSGLRLCRDLVAEGAIGTPISANAFMMNAGPERFHPHPEFLYRKGAGPLFDGGPYDVSALTSILGPITNVSAMSATAHATRTIRTGGRAGEDFAVETPTHVSALLRFANGVVGTLVTSFDVLDTRVPRLEIHGTRGSLIAPAPNSWAGPVLLRRETDSEFSELPLRLEDSGFMGVGVIEMAQAIRAGSAPAASGERGLHVLRVLDAIDASASHGGDPVRVMVMTSRENVVKR